MDEVVLVFDALEPWSEIIGTSNLRLVLLAEGLAYIMDICH